MRQCVGLQSGRHENALVAGNSCEVAARQRQFPPVRLVAERCITEPIYAEVLLAAVVQFVVQGNHPSLCRQEVQLHPMLPVVYAGHRSPFYASPRHLKQGAALHGHPPGRSERVIQGYCVCGCPGIRHLTGRQIAVVAQQGRSGKPDHRPAPGK